MRFGLGGTLLTRDHRCPCEDLPRIAEEHHANLWGHENVVVAPLRCPRTRYWMVVRDPIERIFSRMFDEWFVAQKDHMTRAMATAALNSTLTFPGREHFKEFTGSAALNNYYVRSLTGPAVYSLPLGTVTAKHLEIATAALRAIDVVIPLRNVSALPTLLGSLYGIPCNFPFDPSTVRVQEHSSPNAEMLAAESDMVFMAALRHHNALDERLVLSAGALFEEAWDQSASRCRSVGWHK
mmetsp:Transcript_48170/g.125922  ORF Transcript_48170/g.125922 Transcript_48170/m.125922 type:complete len:238 (+) Transcript_48170:290-1003(+)